MAQLTTHSPAGAPAAARGTEKRRSTGKEPGGIAPSWPSQGRAPARKTRARRKAKPRNPDCQTDTKPHRAITHGWLQKGWSLVDATLYVQAEGLDGDALYERALTVYARMGK